MRLITRKHYLDKLIKVIDTPDIKVITGVRRSGKSKLLEAFKDYVLKEHKDANVIHINYNLPDYEELMEAHKLYDFVNAHYQAQKENYVLIDEVQMCPNFEKAINGMHASEKFNIFITGSNAFLLSSDLATLFTGRTFQISVYPFSFCEFMQYFNLQDTQAAFVRYLTEGGMAGSYVYKDQEDRYDYIKEVFNTLILRDIKQKYKIRNIALLDNVVDFMLDNIANLSSARSITASLIADKERISHKTVKNYLEYLCHAFAFYKIPRYDIRGKRYLSTNDKYYLSDHAFRYAKLGTKNLDYGRVLENIVAIELLRRGYEVYVGILYQKEIDFVAIKRDEKLYIQVADSITDEKTFKREIIPLFQIKDAYPKVLLARTERPDYQYEGIRIMDIANWLANAGVS
jgi:predicted AAA+ superfamily ATPase